MIDSTWNIIVTTKGMTTWNKGLWQRLVEMSRHADWSPAQRFVPRCRITVVVDGRDRNIDYALSEGCEINIIEYNAAPYIWGHAVNVALEGIEESEYILMIHDDIVFPEGVGWLRDLELPFNQDGNIGLAVPYLEGDCPNACQQTDCDLPWFV